MALLHAGGTEMTDSGIRNKLFAYELKLHKNQLQHDYSLMLPAQQVVFYQGEVSDSGKLSDSSTWQLSWWDHAHPSTGTIFMQKV